MKITDKSQFKIGMKIRILTAPESWNPEVNGIRYQYPLNLKYPLEIEIEDIDTYNNKRYYYDFTDGKYSWCTVSAITAGCEIVEDSSTVSRFPFKLNANNCKIVVDIACNEWKEELIKAWGPDLLRYGYVTITEHCYVRMRKSCTVKQHTLFDDIFGRDIILPNYKNGDLLLVKNDGAWFIRYFSHFNKHNGDVFVYDGQKKEGHVSIVKSHKLAGFVLPD